MATTELTTEEKKQLMAALRELHPAIHNDRRRAKRRDVSLTLCIRKIKSGRLESESTDGRRSTRAITEIDLFTATVVNVASQGVALLTRKPLDRGDKLLLPLRFREGGGWLVLCEVRNCIRHASGRHKIGARFVDRIEDPDENAKVPLDWML